MIGNTDICRLSGTEKCNSLPTSTWVFEQGEDKNIDVVKREVRQYEKEIKKRGAAVVNQERTKAEKEKTQKTKAKKK